MASPRQDTVSKTHVFMSMTKQIILVKRGGSKDDALRAARKLYQRPMLYADLNENDIEDAGLTAESLTVSVIDRLSRSCFEILPVAAAAA